MAWVIHGLLEQAALGPDELEAVAEQGRTPLEQIAHRRLSALVSPTDEAELLPSRANMLLHTRVLEAAAERATVVPMRFGVVVPDEDTVVAEYLEVEHDALLAKIERLRGHVELRLRGRYDEATVLREVLASDKRAARLRGREDLDAKMELGERIIAGIEARREVDAERVAAALGDHVAEAAPGPVAEQLDAFTWSFLVSRDGLEAFDRAVDALGEQLAGRIELELVGPVPPFSFADPDTSRMAG